MMASRTWTQRSSPKHASGNPFENVPAEESTGKDQESLMDIDPLLVTHTQPTKLVQPSESSFYHPPPSAQSTAMFGIALGEQGHDVASTQTWPKSPHSHNHGRLTRNQGDGAGVLVLLVTVGWNPRATELAASRCD
jgi:hypothetical protein